MMGTRAFQSPPVSRGAMAVADALHPDIGVTIIPGNTPAKPMAAPAVTLKSSGFFIAPTLGQRHLVPKVAS